MPYKLNSFSTHKIGSLVAKGSFGWTGFSIGFSGGPNESFPEISIDVPVAYSEESKIVDIQAQAFAATIELLRAALNEFEARGLKGLKDFQNARD